MKTVDLNVDLGESVERWESGVDQALLDFVSSANICSGAYAGTPDLIAETCRKAVHRQVAIGAQIGYPDIEGFGRRPFDMSARALADELEGQLRFVADVAKVSGGHVAYVKPHGALYNRIVVDPEHAGAVVEAMVRVGPHILIGLPRSLSLKLAREAGIATFFEGFADRAYTADGQLVPRDEPNALIWDPNEAAEQALSIINQVDTVCLHSDTPGAIELFQAVHRALEAHDVSVAAPW